MSDIDIDWGDYDLYSPGASAPPWELARAQARQVFNKLMAEKPARIAMLTTLLAVNGVRLDDTDAGVQRLNDWFLAGVEPDEAVPGRMAPAWYSVSSDVALFLGDLILGRCPGLRWQFFTWGKRHYSYQQAVIMGFTRAELPRMELNLSRLVIGYGSRIVAWRGSMPRLGTVTIRGVTLDLDEIESDSKPEDYQVDSDEFIQLIRWVEAHA